MSAPEGRAFSDARAQLARAQAAAAAARAAVSRARNAGRGDPALGPSLTRANAELAQAVAGFGAVNDPRAAAQQLADSAPFVLFPVRLETRFGSGRPSKDPAPPAGVPDRAAAQSSPQLWVRIYPDDCSIDTFEADLTATELSNVKKYWQAVWRAAGDSGMEQAAWADLVAAHGSGRAGYLADTFQPSNPADRPVRVAATDEFLVIPTQTELSAAETTAVAQYWSAVWVASTQGDLDAALAALAAAVGAARATELVAGYVPGNLADTPVPPATKTGVTVATVFVVFPPDPPAKPASWTEAPHVAAFPDRFVVLGYRGGEQVLEALGGPITLPLYVGPDPSADPDDAIHPEGADLVIPDELSWLVDFDAAVAAGMGIAVDLTAADAELGFDRLLVLGVSLAADATDVRGGARRAAHPSQHRPGRAVADPAGHTRPQRGRRGDRLHPPRRRNAELRRPPGRTVVHGRHRPGPGRRRAVAGDGPGHRPGRAAGRARRGRHGPGPGPGDAARPVAGHPRLLAGQAARADLR